MRQIVVDLKIVLDVQSVAEALYGIVILAGAESTQPVVFQYVEILLFALGLLLLELVLLVLYFICGSIGSLIDCSAKIV